MLTYTSRLLKKAPLWGAFLLVLGVIAHADSPAKPLTVRHVIDGDSLVLGDGRELRLIGINAPEMRTARSGGPEPLARAARDRLKRLVAGVSVRIVVGPEARDRHDRLLGHLMLADGTSAAEVLLGEGLAVMVAIPPNVVRVSAHQAAEREARRAKRGMWAETYFSPRRVEDITARDTGFRFITGTVSEVRTSRRYVYLDLGAEFSLMIPRSAWRRFDAKASAWRGRRLIARGWVARRHGGGLKIRLAHPSMIKMQATQ